MSVKKRRQMFIFVLTGRRECMTVVWTKNPHFKLLGKHVYVFISKQWVQNIYYWALCSINKSVYFRMERFANPALKGNVFLLCQANLKLKSKLAEAIEKHNTVQGGRNAAVCKTHTLHIDKICTEQYNKFGTLTMRKLHSVSYDSWHEVMGILPCSHISPP